MYKPSQEMSAEEYASSWYEKWTWFKAGSPKNWIAGTPVRIFGFYLGTWWRVARENYPWSCSCAYEDKSKCRAKTHE